MRSLITARNGAHHGSDSRRWLPPLLIFRVASGGIEPQTVEPANDRCATATRNPATAAALVRARCGSDLHMGGGKHRGRVGPDAQSIVGIRGLALADEGGGGASARRPALNHEQLAAAARRPHWRPDFLHVRAESLQRAEGTAAAPAAAASSPSPGAAAIASDALQALEAETEAALRDQIAVFDFASDRCAPAPAPAPGGGWLDAQSKTAAAPSRGGAIGSPLGGRRSSMASPGAAASRGAAGSPLGGRRSSMPSRGAASPTAAAAAGSDCRRRVGTRALGPGGNGLGGGLGGGGGGGGDEDADDGRLEGWAGPAGPEEGHPSFTITAGDGCGVGGEGEGG
jgi:hypothetical protein